MYAKFALELKKLVDFDRANIVLIDPDAGTSTLKYLMALTGRDASRAQIFR